MKIDDVGTAIAEAEQFEADTRDGMPDSVGEIAREQEVPCQAINRPTKARTLITAPGLYPGFPIADYFADPCPEPSLSQSIAKIIIEASPGHAMYAHPRFAQFRVTEDWETYRSSRTIGDVVHKLVLGRGKEVTICNYHDWRSKAARQERDAAIADGEIPVLKKHAIQAAAIATFFNWSMNGHEAPALDKEGETEAVLAWKEDGFWFRSLIDHISKDRLTITDIKTTDTQCPPSKASRELDSDGWDIQAAMIDRGLNAVYPFDAGRRTYRFVTIEQQPPYGLVVNQLSEGILTVGRMKLDKAVLEWQGCLKSGVFPAYPPVINYPELSPWSARDWSNT